MKIKQIELHLLKKIPIEGVPYSNKEASFGMTIEVDDNEVHLNTDEIWNQIKQEVDKGLDEDPDWIRNNKTAKDKSKDKSNE